VSGPSPARRRAVRLAWGLLALSGLALLGAMGLRVAERGRFALPYSSYGAGPEGSRGLFEVLAGEGFRVERWTEDVGRLPAGSALVLLGGCEQLGSRPLSRPERERLAAWIEAGGVFLVAGAGGYVGPDLGVSLRMRSLADCDGEAGLLSRLRAATEEDDEDEEEELPPPVAPPGAEPAFDKPEADLLADPVETLALIEAGSELPEPEWGVPTQPPLLGMPLLGMRNAGAIELAVGADARVLASSGGKIGVVELRRGRGRVIVVASASLFQNRDLVEHGGAVLAARLLRSLAPDRPIYFDEYHVGAGERRSMVRYLTQLGVVPLLAQLGVVLGLVFLARARRFGGVRAAAARPPSSSRAFVSGLAGLFRAAADRRGTLEILARAAIRKVADAHHQPETGAEALADALAARGREAAAQEVRRIAAVPAGPLAAAGSLVQACRELDDATARAVRREPG
jgi:hypothetical protein